MRNLKHPRIAATAGIMVFALAVFLNAAAAAATLHTVPRPERSQGNGFCPDTLLRVTFDQPPVLTGTNRILVYSGTGDLADTIDLSSNNNRPRAAMHHRGP